MKKPTISRDLVKHLSVLANVPLTENQIEKLPDELSTVIEYMSKIITLDTNNIVETSQVTNLENIFREDEIDEKRTLTQDEALSNATEKHNGYFKVKAIFE